MNIPEKLKNMTPYTPDTSLYDIRLDANESFLEPPFWLQSKIMEAVIGVNLNRYPDPLARKVCMAAAEYYGVPADCCVAGNGSDELISIIISALLPRGGRVVVAEPDFSMYRFCSELCEVECIDAGRDDGYPSVESLLGASHGADMLIFSNPCNPTGKGMRVDDALRLAGSAGCLVVIDEAYMDFWDQSVVDMAPARDNLIVLRTCSKAFGLAGARLGFAITNARIAGLLKTVKSPYNVSAVTQAVGLAVLEEHDYLHECADMIKKSKASLFVQISELLNGRAGYEAIETHTNFVIIKLPDPAAVHAALKQKGVSVRNIGGLLRITAGSAGENRILIDRLREVLDA